MEPGQDETLRQLEKCTFTTHDGYRSSLIVADLDVIDPKLATDDPTKAVRNARIVIRASRSNPKCDPYDVHDSPDTVAEGTPILAMTYAQYDLLQTTKVDAAEPLAYPCAVRKSGPMRDGRPGAMYSDCDLEDGGNGGFGLVRNADGRWGGAMIFQSMGPKELNGLPYDEKTKSFTASYATNGDFTALLTTPGVRPKLPAPAPTPVK